MGFLVKNREELFVEIEDTAGTYKAPTASTSAVQTLGDGAEIAYEKELKERDVMNASLGKSTPRPGMRGTTSSVPVELRASETEGAAPEYDAFLMSLLGSKKVQAAVTSDTGHTTTTIELALGEGALFEDEDVVVVKEAGDYHVTPVTVAGDTLTMKIAMDSAPSDNVEIAAFTTYRPVDDGKASLSITQFLDKKVKRGSRGNLATGMTLENFTTGEIASLTFTTSGLDFEDEALEVPAFDADFQDALPPLILGACVYQDGVQIKVNNLTLSVEQAVGTLKSTCSESGKIANRPTEFTVSGSFNPYKLDDSVANFSNFKNNTEFSVFLFVANPTLVDGEKTGVMAFNLPNCITTSYAKGEEEGISTDEIEFSATRGAEGSEDEIIITAS